ncbi:MAG: phosphoribosylanthranilate isomerase [Chloroflexi bacterium]|nr:phosphoribosylanthranilate isomerase [Chloroflexota bacterium]
MSAQKKVKVKVCGITSIDDARLAAEAGADYIGVIIEIDYSPRRLTVEQALPICQQSTLPVVTVVFNWSAKQIQKMVSTLHPHAVQLLGQEPPSLVKNLKNIVTCELWKSIHLPPRGLGEIDIAEYRHRIDSLIDAGIDAILIDTVASSPQGNRRYGGTGQVSNWDIARKLVQATSVRTFLAGGINPQNIQSAIELVRPYGIDLCNGVESTPGHKDAKKLHQLMLAIRRVVPIKR